MVAGARPHARERLDAAQAAFDDLFRHDGGTAMAAWFTDDAQLLWPEAWPIVGPEAIGQAFADFAAAFETISYEPAYDLVEVEPPLAARAGTFIETRRVRETGLVERVFGRIALIWRQVSTGEWLCAWAMTSRYAPTEVIE